jgi:hypothetical protein
MNAQLIKAQPVTPSLVINEVRDSAALILKVTDDIVVLLMMTKGSEIL